ncbi:class I SAM-dependent methyltransferase [Desulfovibrio sp. ZJ369]|uniref:class I SAM-dependent methyltransferase n=1 Tax=Desulfovibrio sp. ZJ369 TaxID=2709793 RepID=UPI0013ED848C|nr:class I SAM-dependent methyltransferase [Desulfovibrio sp. ZJ369]
MQFEQFAGTRSRSRLLRFVDHRETYGPQVIKKYLKHLNSVESAVDIGAGTGRDLGFVKNSFPESSLHAIECMSFNISSLEKQNIKTYPINIETEPLPFHDKSIDLVICNQILEHTKELFWIFHEITRILKIGGYLIVGVPNIASLHNRIGLLLGHHPTQAKACSAHIRCFSKNDFLLFLKECFGEGYILKSFDGSQFYPFPSFLARPLARFFPGMAFSIFFLLQKAAEYKDSFLEYPAKAKLATNFKISLESGGS